MTKVRALQTREQVNEVSLLLNKHYGKHYQEIWLFAVNVALRMGDVLNIKMSDAKTGIKSGYLEIKEQKKSKYNRFDLNLRAKEIIESRIKQHPKDDWLFQSHANNAKANKRPITRDALYKALKSVGDIIGVKLGTHSARKSRGRIMYSLGSSLEDISRVLNHDDIKTTFTYIDITQEEKDKTFHELVF